MCKSCGCSYRSKDFGNIERFVEPCILLLLSKEASHGYGLMEDLEKHCGEKVDIGNLYRTLRKMEALGLVTSSWEKGNGSPDKRIYEITEDGKEALSIAASDLTKTRDLVDRFLEGYKKLKIKKRTENGV